MNPNMHFHTSVLDGVFVREPDGSLGFAAKKTPSVADMRSLLDSISIGLRYRFQERSE